MLTKKFGDKERRKYHIVEIKTEDLEAERKSCQRKKFERVKCLSVLQVIIFKPGQPYFKDSAFVISVPLNAVHVKSLANTSLM